jgi:hypothetical protein
MEIPVFLAGAFAVLVLLLWRGRRRTSRDVATYVDEADRPEAAISNESRLGPHGNVGRPWRVDRGGRPSGGTTEDL